MSFLSMMAGSDPLASLIYRPSLEVYLDAIASPITKDGSNNVTVWGDLSGKGHHAQQSGSDPVPVYVANKNGYPAIYSDGATGRKLDFSHGVTNNDPFTVIALFLGDTAVSDPSTGSSLNIAYAFGGGDASDNSVAMRQLRTAANDMNFVAYGSGSGLNGGPFSNFEAFTIAYNGTNTYCYYGATQDPDSGVAAGSTRVFGIGRLFNQNPESSSRTGIGWLRSLLLFKEMLPDTLRNTIVTAMKARYGIV